MMNGMKLPKISVITITYGHENFILDTLRGVLSQEYDGIIEFIIGNDNSPDKTDDVINDFLNSIEIAENIEIRYINRTENIGMMPNFISLLNQASGEYIALCEGDDYWVDPLKLQKQVSFLEKNLDYMISYHHVHELNIKGELNVDSFNSSSTINEVTLEKLAEFGNCIHTPSVVFRRLAEPLPDDFSKIAAGDYPLYLILAQHGKINCIPEYMAVYRRHDSSVWSSKPTEYIYRKWLDVLFFLIDYFEDNKEIRKLLLNQFANSYMILYRRLASLGMDKEIDDLHIYIYRKYTLLKEDGLYNLYVAQNTIHNSESFNKLIGKILKKVINRFRR